MEGTSHTATPALQLTLTTEELVRDALLVAMDDQNWTRFTQSSVPKFRWCSRSTPTLLPSRVVVGWWGAGGTGGCFPPMKTQNCSAVQL